MKISLALLIALSACGDDVAYSPDAAMPPTIDSAAQIDAPTPAVPECKMGNLPTSRTITINNGDPVPPELLNEIQDVIIGGKYSQIGLPIAAAAFFCESGSGVFANGLWSGATAGSVKLVYGINDMSSGTRIDDILFYSGPAGTPTFTLSRMSINDGGVTSQVITAGGGAIGSWGAIDLGGGSGTISLPHVIDLGFQYFLTATLAAHTPPLQFGGAIVLRARP